MAAILIAAGSAVFGIPSAETGLNIANIKSSAAVENARLLDRQGEINGSAYFNPTVTFTLDGEIDGSTGHAAATTGTACTIANTMPTRTPSAVSAIYYEGIEDTLARGAWRLFSATAFGATGLTP